MKGDYLAALASKQPSYVAVLQIPGRIAGKRHSEDESDVHWGVSSMRRPEDMFATRFLWFCRLLRSKSEAERTLPSSLADSVFGHGSTRNGYYGKILTLHCIFSK